MSDRTDDEAGGDTFASPPCFLHEIDPAWSGIVNPVDPQQRRDVMRWRRAERKRLIDARLGIDRDERRALDVRILDALDACVGALHGQVVSLYWPVRGEPDLRPWADRIRARGGNCALPVVVRHGEPLRFRPWTETTRLVPGRWNIPEPEVGAGEELRPDILIAPVVGFDPGGYRLGYGGGFFDRTLAARTDAPRVIGVGYAFARLATIFPQPHDIPMQAVVTEEGVLQPDAVDR